MPEIPAQYFLKELPEQPLFLPSGQKVAWELIDYETGVISTTDPSLIFQLSNAANARRGGVVRINEEQYQDLIKKKQPENPSLPPPGRLSLPQAPLRAAPNPSQLMGMAQQPPAKSVNVAEPKPEPPPEEAKLPTPNPEVVRNQVRRGKIKPA